MTSKVNYDALLKDCLDSILNTGGTFQDAMIIEGHFGLIGDWIIDILARCKLGQCTAADVAVINKQLAMYSC